jgi:hypothetical protein
LLSFSALDQWWLGYPEQALIRCNQAVAGDLAQKDPYGQAFATGVGCTVLFLLRSERLRLQECCMRCLSLSSQQGFSMWQPYAEVFQGWLRILGDEYTAGNEYLTGEGLAGVTQMQNAISLWQDMGMTIGADGLVMVLADGYLAAARRCRLSDDTTRNNLLRIALTTIEPFLGPQVPYGQSYQAELYRLKGEVLLERAGLAAAGEALACFEHSLQLGQAMGALAWELRTAMSVVRLRMRQGEAYVAELAAARSCLQDLHARFTEGFGFPDLQEAAELLLRANLPVLGDQVAVEAKSR